MLCVVRDPWFGYVIGSVHAEYVDFLSKVTPRNVTEYKTQMDRFNLGLPGEADCPVFEGVFKYCQVGTRSLLACSHPLKIRSSMVQKSVLMICSSEVVHIRCTSPQTELANPQSQ
jgi:hypothetical protein